MGRFVIAAYKPKPGMEPQLDAVVARHMKVLAAEGLVTDRPAYVMRAADGTVVEVFEWRSAEAIERAYNSAAVDIGQLWAEFAAVCDYVPLVSLNEAQQPFAEVEPVRL